MATTEAVLKVMHLWAESNLSVQGGWPTTSDAWMKKADTWSALLFDVPDGELFSLALSHMEQGARFAPTPGELLKMRPTDPRESWEHGWDTMRDNLVRGSVPEWHEGMRKSKEAYDALHKWKPRRRRFSEHQAQQTAIERGIAALGGYTAACNMKRTDADRAAFRDAYNRSMEQSRLDTSRKRAALTGQVMAGQLSVEDAREAMDPSVPPLRVLEGGR